MIVIGIIIFIYQQPCYAEIDWEDLYDNSKPFETKLMNNIDPFQDEDNIKYAYSPYPLFRTSVVLYYKGTKIDSGYYQLTPRKINGRYFIFFKTCGKVQYIIPVVKRELVEATFYQKYIPEPKLTRGQRFSKKWKDFWKKIFKDSGKQPPPSSYVELQNLDTCYVLKFYFKNHCYFSVYKKVPY
jgi:hypothetical protein